MKYSLTKTWTRAVLLAIISGAVNQIAIGDEITSSCFKTSECVYASDCRPLPRPNFDNLFYFANRTVTVDRRIEYTCSNQFGAPVTFYRYVATHTRIRASESHNLWHTPRSISQIPDWAILSAEQAANEECQNKIESEQNYYGTCN